jgi:phosphate transport system substrate-binding protein
MSRIPRALGLLFITAVVAAPAGARDRIRIVGSSTVYPFATVVAEEFGRHSQFKTPIIESTGSGGGIKLFCAGVGDATPDIANASRRIKASEVAQCAAAGVIDITEVKIGYDGIVIANANAKGSKRYELTLRDVFLALAREVPTPSGKSVPNPYKTWKDVDPRLPAVEIEVFGPPPTSGTRDAFVELAMDAGCKTFPELAALEKSDKDAFQKACQSIREDGAWIDAGENDNLIVQKLVANEDALGVFGYSFLEENEDKVQGSIVGGSEPSFENIASGAYPLSRPLYFYVKSAHVSKVPGMREYIAEFTSEKAIGDLGYVTDKGLIPAPKAEREKFRADAAKLLPLALAGN